MICLYEDDGYQDLFPLVALRPVWNLLCGRRTLLEKLRVLYPHERIALLTRPELVPLARELHPECKMRSAKLSLYATYCMLPTSAAPVLFLSGRVIFNRPLPVQGEEEVFLCGNEVVGFRARPSRVKSLPISRMKVRGWSLPQRQLQALPGRPVQVSIVRYPWNLIEFNEAELARELAASSLSALRMSRLTTKHHRIKHEGTKTQMNSLGVFVPLCLVPSVVFIGNPAGLLVSRTARVQPGTVFDLTQGRVYLDEGSEVRVGSVVAGPGYVGKGTILDRALVRPGCSFGPDCRIGGEVAASVFLGHVNKQHDGFIGHAVIGEWVNLGALTTNSDLRNDYGEVKVIVNGRSVNTGLRKVGSIIGDQVKTAIGTLLNTGVNIGIFANWFEPGLSPKVIPAFAWGKRQRWPLDELIATARVVMARRGVQMSPTYETLVRRYYAQKTASG
jgi:UDP-N-acetylglucosamine diphosphorylase/glucosamine-1-phosphate N-acetyltransferase